MTTALLIVDVQNDFVEGGALGVAGGTVLAERVTKLTRKGGYDLVVASRDWHDANSSNGGHFADGEPNFTTTWPVHCVAGTEGADFAPGIDTALIDLEVRKGQGEPAYSAFEGVIADGADAGRPLADALRDRGVTGLDVVGIATDHCVRASVLDALRDGFAVRVLTNLVAGVAKEPSAAALREMTEAGATLAEASL